MEIDRGYTQGWQMCVDEYQRSVLNVKVLVGTFYQKKAIVGAFSVIVKYSRTHVASSNVH